MKYNKITLLRFVPALYYPSNLSQRNIGGVQIQTYRLIKAFSKCNVSQDVLTKNKGKIELKNVNVMHPANQNIISLFLFSVIYLFRNKKKYDCIHIHADGGPCPLLFGQVAHAFFDIPIVYTFHCCRNVTYKTKGLEILLKPFMNRLEKKSIQDATHCVFLSDKTADALKKQGVLRNEKCYSIISDCIEVIERESLLKGSINKKEIAFIGRISKEKGWNVFIECARKLKEDDFKFHIYGTGPQSKKLMCSVKKNGLTNVYYHGVIPNDKIFEVISAVNIIMVPSYFEELGSVVLESGVMKKNVIASNTGGLAEILSNNRGYLVKVGDSDGFCNGIKHIVNNDIKYGEKLYEYISSNYSIDKVLRDYLSVYENLKNISIE